MGKKKKKGKLRCFLYTRVSTKMQLDGYSLESQENKMRKYADLHDMDVVRVYSDEGKSGKNIEGRPAFVEMMDAIKDGTAQVDYVVVYKLSRFGRNTADTLNSVQDLQDNGVQLAVVEEGIDTAKSSGKLLVSVLAAVAEIERENILAQTQAGREQKAMDGKWNGGFAPYGYRLRDGELQIEEEEAKIIRTIYDLYTNQALGLAGVAKYLNTHGVVKKVRQNGTLARFSSAFVKGVLDNPVYMGKISYGRRRTEKKDNGRRNDFHVVKQDEFEIYDGIHEAIVSEELWNKTHEKRVRTGVKSERLYNKGRVHLLTGILKCPVCGGPLYGNVNRN